MATVKIDFNRQIGNIKPLHGVGQPPMLGMDYSMFSYLKEAHIPFSRLHDVGGRYGSFVYADIPNLFRDFDADPTDPASYDFAFTDRLLASLSENQVEPFFRLGVTIENYFNIRAYRIYPPKDPLKWAKICEGVIRHYTQGWANGYHYAIRYWELWNEPDNGEVLENNQMWLGTKEQFYELYHVAATYLKQQFPHLKIGGYGSCGFYALRGSFVSSANSSPRHDYFIEFFDGFLDYIKAHASPLDFFSWHSYDDVETTAYYADYARRRLDQAGYTATETSCNEWNYLPGERGKPCHTSNNTAMLIRFQQGPLDTAMFYDARLGLSVYGGLFHPMERRPYPLYYGFKAFGDLYVLGKEVFSSVEGTGIYALAATDGQKGGILLVNTGEDTELSLEVTGQKPISCKVIGDEGPETCKLPATLPKDSVWYLETALS